MLGQVKKQAAGQGHGTVEAEKVERNGSGVEEDTDHEAESRALDGVLSRASVARYLVQGFSTGFHGLNRVAMVDQSWMGLSFVDLQSNRREMPQIWTFGQDRLFVMHPVVG